LRNMKRMPARKDKRVAIVAGVGPGLGAALVRMLAGEGCSVGMFARSAQFIGKFAAELGSNALAVPTDVSDGKQVTAGFREVRQQLGPVQSLAVELWPKGIHVAHVIIDGVIDTPEVRKRY